MYFNAKFVAKALQIEGKILHWRIALEISLLSRSQTQFINAIEECLVAHFKHLGGELPVPSSSLECH